jgi:predicted dehydrogenase
MNPDNRYYVTKWRQKAQFPGGWLMDAGVHHVAELRFILGEITQVQAQATLFREDLPPYDTMTATLNFESGVLGNYSATYATNVDYRMYLDITGEDGYMIVTPDSLEIFPKQGDSQRFEKQGGFSVAEELKAFADAILEGKAQRNSAQEGLQDVAVMEAFLTSIESGHMVYVPQFVYGL